MKILVGYDGSNVTKAALELARQHAKVWGAKLDVVNCKAQNRDLEYKDIRKAEEKLEGEVRYILNSEKVPYETHLLISSQSFGEELVDYAKQNKVDEIIIGIRKKIKNQQTGIRLYRPVRRIKRALPGGLREMNIGPSSHRCRFRLNHGNRTGVTVNPHTVAPFSHTEKENCCNGSDQDPCYRR